MKYACTFLLLCGVTFAPAQAQLASDSAPNGVVAADSETDAQVLKKKIKAEEQARDDKIKAMEKTVAKDPSIKKNRQDLAEYLESLGSDSEKNDDWPGVWRFYQRAAAVRRDPAEQDWETRAAEDTAKATSYRQKQTDKRVAEEEAKAIARRVRDMPAIVAPSLDLETKKKADAFAENRYREEVWKRVQNAWVKSELRRSVSDTSNFKKPAIVSFEVNSEGEISDIKITSTSGDRRIDLAALKIVEDLGKVEPLLPGMGPLVRFQTEFGK